jgi:hypothetical protein
MIRFFVFVLLILGLTNCRLPSQKKSSNIQKKELQICLKLLKDSAIKNIQENYNYPAKISLTNHTDSIIAYWGMSCSWEDNYLFDTKNITFISQGCDKNIPQFIELKKDQTIEYDCVLNMNSDSIKLFKVGFVLLEEYDFKEYENRINWRAFLLKHKIYWSDTIYIE